MTPQTTPQYQSKRERLSLLLWEVAAQTIAILLGCILVDLLLCRGQRVWRLYIACTYQVRRGFRRTYAFLYRREEVPQQAWVRERVRWAFVPLFHR